MFFAEPIQNYSQIPDTLKSYAPLNMRKQPSVNQGTKNDQQKPGNNGLFIWLNALLAD